MMFEKDDLGLSLGQKYQENQLCNSSSARINLLTGSVNWMDTFNSSSNVISTDREKSFLKGIDVNRIRVTAGTEAEVTSANSTISSISGKRSDRDLDFDGEKASSRGISDEEDGEISRKKLRLSKHQSAVLEESFNDHSTLNPKQKQALAKKLGLRPRQVEVWFQNRRARTKLKQTEVDCEYMKRCCENLTEENRRLQRELQELRALKLSPQFYMQRTPPTTLTMCHSCDHVTVPPQQSSLSTWKSHTKLPFNPWAYHGQ
ncbi:homeobox-leucine zipper protein HAT4-like [Rutidosis leptorrhynchoides]|uniref:homeobox-leucine zipper protein HAT4-like n=1 Tax=Rutidosis leptorrhynchoides TaxID=125765 RepID=UPI003A98F4C7